MTILEFQRSAPLTIGVELELQVLNTRDCDLTRGASDLLALLARESHPGDIKPEITESMIEVSTSVHTRYAPLAKELRGIRAALVKAADRLNLAIAGGGAHPFQHWSERRIYEGPRFKYLSDLYGYLAKQFTVFGQHVHIGCPHGDDALFLLHAMSRYVPHFIALAASSPYYQGVDTAFDSSRLHAITAFPLSGRAPFSTRWSEFTEYFDRMRSYGIVESMKDFYWDIRPKPEYGTIEIRVFDTPLTVERAAALAAYAQALARYLLVERHLRPTEDLYLVYTYNRFQACRFGMEGNFIDPVTQKHRPLREDILSSIEAVGPHARELEAGQALTELKLAAGTGGNDAGWMRAAYGRSQSLQDLMWQASRRWSGER
ncbi:MAG: glutamate--cysteine ligase [Betaproteobacteria bacterium RIFCSPLOWO2_02_FULL_65_24]|nr:MAG: glutamate--cysteine ligase [Betaproteobacteria bacterium RIFCSPLOWO2_02_FULL_65_24]OGA88016.1 MAG: glutamate--cysteine ligase [Betaproteobacteria bacterium RIFCSPLOWO2_12_FULL_66_14]